MKILGVNRVELLVKDPQAEASRVRDLLGVEFGHSETPEHGVRSATSFEAGLELAGPTRDDSPLAALLENNGEGLLTIVFRVDSIEDVLAMAQANGLSVLADLDFGDSEPRYRSYRQVSLSSERFPAGASFTFAEYEEA